MDQRDSIIIGHFSLDLDVFIFILLCYFNKFLSVLYALSRVYFNLFIFILLYPMLTCSHTQSLCCLIAPNHAVFMYVDRLIKCFDLHVTLLLVDECAELGLQGLCNLALPLFLPVKKLILKALSIGPDLLGLVHSLKVLIEAFLLVFLLQNCVHIGLCRRVNYT
jgi:hypothetical protein